MLINWFTVIAQIVNFLVLVGLLKHFLWGPLVRAIDERQARIAAELKDAETTEYEAQQQMSRVKSIAREQEEKANDLLLQARHEADQERLRMIDESRRAVRAMEAQWYQDLERQRTTFLNELRRRAATEILAVTRQALADLASEDLQHSSMAVFLANLQSFDLVQLEEMTKSMLVVRSAAELTNEAQQEIRTALEKRTGLKVPLQFVRDPAMAWGIELRGNGRRIGWNPESYLDSLEQKLQSELDRAPGAAAQVAAG